MRSFTIQKISRPCYFSCLFVIVLSMTNCKKNTIINNYYSTPSDSSRFGLLATPNAIYNSYPVASIPSETLASSFTLDIPTTPFYQGNQGSCSGCASAMAKSIMDHIEFNSIYPNNKIIYSPAYLYNQAKSAGDCSVGSYVDNNLIILQSQGICKETEMPYNPISCTLQPTIVQKNLAANNKISGFEILGFPLIKNNIKQLINAKNPIIVCFKVDTKFNSLDQNSVWTSFGAPIMQNNDTARHAALIVGWDDSKYAFEILNSWGSSWGSNGKGWVSYDMVENGEYFYQGYKINNMPPGGNSLTITGDLNFPNTTVGSTNSKTIQLSNTSSNSITVSNVSINSPFTTNWSNGTIPAGASVNLTITFAPGSVSNFSQTLTITSNGANSPNTLQAKGSGISAAGQTRIINLTGSMAFGNVTVGQSLTRILTISNTGSSILTISNITAGSGQFTVGSWTPTIAAGQSQNVNITFAPTNGQTFSTTLQVTSDATSGTSSMALSGTGTSTTPVISLSGSMAFGNVSVGQPLTKTLTITNNGQSTMTISNISSSSSKFTVGSWTPSVAPNQSQNVPITFTPTNDQTYSSVITVSSNATGTNTITATGTGISAAPTVVPALGSYASCPGTNGSIVCTPTISYGQGVVNARIVNINTSTRQIVFELKKCNGTAFSAGGSMHIVYSLCAGGPTIGSRTFFTGDVTVQHTVTETNMTGTKIYYVYTLQSGSSNNIYYHAQPITVTY
jgi:hypothetical protein